MNNYAVIYFSTSLICINHLIFHMNHLLIFHYYFFVSVWIPVLPKLLIFWQVLINRLL